MLRGVLSPETVFLLEVAGEVAMWDDSTGITISLYPPPCFDYSTPRIFEVSRFLNKYRRVVIVHSALRLLSIPPHIDDHRLAIRLPCHGSQ